ncbi:F0F1 ATP synthase subunit delta [Dermacoccaceae bacterium W4C1]
MDGASRGALTAGRKQLEQVLGSADPSTLSTELQLVDRTLDGSAALRRALGDPAKEPAAKQKLAASLFSSHIGEPALSVVTTLAGQRWSADRDLADAVDLLVAESIVAGAEKEGRLDRVEQELFQVGRTVQTDSDLREALANRQRSGADKATLVDKLLESKAAPETTQLATLAASNPRGQRFDQALERYAKVAAGRREQLVALVTVANPLSDDLADRLRQTLADKYGKPIQLNVVVDQQVVGGVRVQIGDDVIDGTIARRLDDARRALAG